MVLPNQTSQLRTELREELKDIKKDLSLMIIRIEESFRTTMDSHNDASNRRQNEICNRLDKQEERIMENMKAMSDWRIDVEKRLAEQKQFTRLSVAMYALVVSSIATAVIRFFIG
jgi:hypothetical protein